MFESSLHHGRAWFLHEKWAPSPAHLQVLPVLRAQNLAPAGPSVLPTRLSTSPG